jgi:hypothetical protein
MAPNLVSLSGVGVIQPETFIGFWYKCTGFGADRNPVNLFGFGAIHKSKLYKFIGFWAIHGSKLKNNF